jgi:hypothetical protein
LNSWWNINVLLVARTTIENAPLGKPILGWYH